MLSVKRFIAVIGIYACKRDGVSREGHLRDLGRHVKLQIAAGYISIPEGEGQFVPVIWWVHGDSLTVIQSLATLFLFPLPPSSSNLSLLPFIPCVRPCCHPSPLQRLPYSVVIESPAILTEWRLFWTVRGFCKYDQKLNEYVYHNHCN